MRDYSRTLNGAWVGPLLPFARPAVPPHLPCSLQPNEMQTEIYSKYCALMPTCYTVCILCPHRTAPAPQLQSVPLVGQVDAALRDRERGARGGEEEEQKEEEKKEEEEEEEEEEDDDVEVVEADEVVEPGAGLSGQQRARQAGSPLPGNVHVVFTSSSVTSESSYKTASADLRRAIRSMRMYPKGTGL